MLQLELRYKFNETPPNSPSPPTLLFYPSLNPLVLFPESRSAAPQSQSLIDEYVSMLARRVTRSAILSVIRPRSRHLTSRLALCLTSPSHPSVSLSFVLDNSQVRSWCKG